MKKVLALLALAASAATSNAAGHVVVSLIPRVDTNPGRSVTLDIWVDWRGVTGGLALAGFKFDVLGHENGTLMGDVNNERFNQGVNNGTTSGANLLDFGGGQLPPGIGEPPPPPDWIGTLTYTDNGTARENYSVALSIIDYATPDGALNVYTGGGGAQSRSSYTSSTGTNHLVQFDIGSFEVIVPSPASAAVLALAGMATARRRRS